MKAFGAVALLLLATLVALPSASAQSAGVTLVCPDLAAPIPYSGTSGLACTVTAQCVGFLTGGGSADGSVSVVGPPGWLTAPETPVEFDPTACIASGGTASADVTIPLTVGADAPGVVEHVLNLVATGGGAEGTDTAIVTVAYHVNYTVVADVAFPLNVTGPEASFNVTVTQASNARSMVMMEQTKVSAGTLSGPISKVYENDAGKPVTETFKFTYKAPEGEWTNATATFTAFGHYLLTDGRAGEFNTPACTALGFPTCDATGTPMTFTFTNGVTDEDDDEDGNGIPAPVAPLLLLGILALAMLVRRRA